MKFMRFSIPTILLGFLMFWPASNSPILAQGSAAPNGSLSPNTPSNTESASEDEISGEPDNVSDSGVSSPSAQTNEKVPPFWPTIKSWGTDLEKRFSWYALALGVAFSAYVFGYICFVILFYGVRLFGPAAAATGLWVSTFVLLINAIILSPLAWPWWYSIGMFVAWIVLTLLVVGSFSKKSAA